MMQLVDVHKNSVTKRYHSIEFGLVWFVLTSTLMVDGNQSLMMELQDVDKNSVIKRHNSIKFVLVRFILIISILDRK